MVLIIVFQSNEPMYEDFIPDDLKAVRALPCLNGCPARSGSAPGTSGSGGVSGSMRPGRGEP